MASSNFTIAPSTGTGNGTITVTPRSTNTAHSDKKARVTITNAGRTAEADIIQYGIPSITLLGGSTTLPSNGGTLAYSIYSRYPFGFTNKPDWVTVYDGYGNYYSSNAEISPSLAGRTFYIEIGNWDRNMDRRTDDYLFAFSYKKVQGGSWDSNSTLFGIVQQGSSSPEEHLNVSPLFLVFDYDSTSNKEVTVDASSTAWTVTNTSGNFTATKSNSTTLLIRPLSTNGEQGGQKRTGTVTIGLNGLSKTISVQQYAYPTLRIQSTDPGESSQASIPMEGGSRSVVVTSDYEWWFLTLPIPDYITIYDGHSQEVNYSYYNPYDPSSTGVRQPIFTFTWDENTTDDPRVDSFYLGIIDAQGNTRTFGRNTIRFTQLNTPTRIHQISSPDRLSVSNISGTERRLNVLAYNCSWMFSDIPNYITSITDENGNAVSGWQTGDGIEHTYYATWAGLSSSAEPREWQPMILWKYTEGGVEVTGRDYMLQPFTQYPYLIAPTIVLGDADIYIPYYGGETSFVVTSDYEWYWFGVPSYVSAIVDEDGNNAYYTVNNKCTNTGTPQTYYWIIGPNTGSTSRTFRGKMSYYNGSETITLDAGIEFRQFTECEVYPTMFNTDYHSGVGDVLVSFSEVPWSYSIDNGGQQFISVIDANTDLDYTKFKFSFTTNQGSQQRTGVVTFTDHNGSTKTLEIRQAGQAVYTATPNPVQAGAAAGTYSVSLNMANAWTYTINDNWITVTASTGQAGSSTLGIRVSANETISTRNGSISLKVSGTEVLRVSVSQVAAATENISVTPAVFYIPADSASKNFYATVDSTGPWNAQSSDYSIVGVPGHSGGAGVSEAIFYVQNNNSNNTRQEYIYFEESLGDSVAAAIIQYGSNQVYPFDITGFEMRAGGQTIDRQSGDSYILPANTSGASCIVLVNRNGTSVSSISNNGWIHQQYQGANPDGDWYIVFNVDANNTGIARHGYITITAANGVRRMVYITQSAT